MIIFLLTYWASDFITSHVPTVDLSGVNNSFTYIAQFLRFGGYFLPMGTVSAIFLIMVAIIGFVLVVNIIKTIWDLIPLF